MGEDGKYVRVSVSNGYIKECYDEVTLERGADLETEQTAMAEKMQIMKGK